jgi:hypothetical protein
MHDLPNLHVVSQEKLNTITMTFPVDITMTIHFTCSGQVTAKM